MQIWDRHAKHDEMETLEQGGWQLLCSGEQLPTGDFHAVVRYRTAPGEEIRTLLLDHERHASAAAALARAKELALKWAQERGRWPR
jgi:hypothetical protein